MSKLDVRPIVTDHWETLRDMGGNRTSVTDVMWFVVLPLASGVALLLFKQLLTSGTVVVLITALSIFAGLLLNLLLLTHGIVTSRSGSRPSARRLTLVKEVYRNISYAILVSLLAVATLVIVSVITMSTVQWVGSGVTYFLVGHFLLTLLMILKRVHVMLAKEYEPDA